MISAMNTQKTSRMRLLLLAALTLAITSCGNALTPIGTTSATTVSKPTSYFGESATAVASRIDGCANVKAGDIANGGPALASIASCTLDGRTVVVYSWSDSKGLNSVTSVLEANRAETYYALGNGWTTFVQPDETLKWQLTNQADKLLGSTPNAAVDLPGQKAASEKIAESLGGVTKNYKP